MVNVDALYEALVLVFSFDTLLWLAIGVFIGVGVGAMPGLTATTGVALMLPLTFTMGQAPALGLLIGLYKGAVYGGSISAISFATRAENTWRHKWQPGDLVMWDNRCVLHRRDGFDDKHTRLMHRTQIKGTEAPIAP